MFEQRIIDMKATASAPADPFAAVNSLRTTFQDFAAAGEDHAAVQHEISADVRHPLAARYAGANSITRRRLDALLREAETMAAMGMKLVGERGARRDSGTIAAARFLGRSLDSTLRRAENLLAPAAI